MRYLGCATGVVAFAAFATIAGGQIIDVPPWGGEVRADPVGYPGGYQGRAVRQVYAHGQGAPRLAQANVPQVLEDVSFSPGFWATGAGRVISRLTYSLEVMGTPTTTEQVLLVFWDKDDVNFSGFSGPGTNMINPGAAPLAALRVSLGALAPNFIYDVTTSLTGIPGGGVHVPDGDSGVAIQVAWIDGGCTPAQYQDLSACIHGGCAGDFDRMLVLGAVASGPGSTTPDYGRDYSDSAHCDTIGRFVGGGVGGEHAQAGTALSLVLYGDIAPVTCTADFNGDGDPGTDADIEAFFACLAGNCCATCGSADFNADGDTGTDADIEAFFRVLAGGDC